MNKAIITPLKKADYVITPDFYLYVDAPHGSNMSTLTLLVPGDNPYIIRFNRNTGNFHRNGLKETKENFQAFVKRIVSMTPAWHPSSDPEKVLFNTFKSAARTDKVAATFSIDRNFTPSENGNTYPIQPTRTDTKHYARVRVNINSSEVIHPPYDPTHIFTSLRFSLDVVLDDFLMPSNDSALIVQSGFSFRGMVDILTSTKSSFIHFSNTKIYELPIVQKIFGVRDVDIQALIVRAIANGNSYANDGENLHNRVEVNSCKHSVLLEAMEECGEAFIRNLEKLDSKKSSAA